MRIFRQSAAATAFLDLIEPGFILADHNPFAVPNEKSEELKAQSPRSAPALSKLN
jgi:hypothetical protein